MTSDPTPQDDLPESAQPAPGWDEGRVAVPARYDYAALLRYDWQIRWTLYGGALPFVLPVLELVLFSNRMTSDSIPYAALMLIGLLSLGARRRTIRWGVNFLYLGYFAIQYQLFGKGGLYVPLPFHLYLFSAIGGVSLICNLVATILLTMLRQARMPVELEDQIGNIFGSQKEVRRVLEIYRTADEARANQAWTKQAGRQE